MVGCIWAIPARPGMVRIIRFHDTVASHCHKFIAFFTLNYSYESPCRTCILRIETSLWPSIHDLWSHVTGQLWVLLSVLCQLTSVYFTFFYLLCYLIASSISVAGINRCMTANVSHTVSLTSVSASFLDCNSSAAASSCATVVFGVGFFGLQSWCFCLASISAYCIHGWKLRSTKCFEGVNLGPVRSIHTGSFCKALATVLLQRHQTKIYLCHLIFWCGIFRTSELDNVLFSSVLFGSWCFCSHGSHFHHSHCLSSISAIRFLKNFGGANL